MTRSDLASVHLDVGEERQEVARPEPDSPFRILVAGNFSGGAGRNRKPVFVDRDNFEDVLARLAPNLEIESGKFPGAIRFRDLDDFHPDALYAKLPAFQALRDMREQLEGGTLVIPETSASAAPAAPAPNLSGADLLNSLLGETAAPAVAPKKSAWDAMVEEIVKPHTEAKPDRRLPAMIAQTDAAIASEMRAVLHHPKFQNLEAAWRGLFFLVRRLETSPDLKVYLLDLPQADLGTAEGKATLRKVVVDDTVGTPGAELWSVVAGLYYFSNDDEALVAEIGGMAHAAGAPFLAGVARELIGADQVLPSFRPTRDARWVGLVMPRFLLRLPYGAKTDSTERFDFEEMTEVPAHEGYLWGNPSLVCTLLLGEAFSRSGWDLRPGEVNQVEGLPAHVYLKDGEPELKPCAEVLLSESSLELLLEQGFMPLVSLKGSDRVRLARFQSVADPPAALSGRWS